SFLVSLRAPAPPAISPLSLHDALPIYVLTAGRGAAHGAGLDLGAGGAQDRTGLSPVRRRRRAFPQAHRAAPPRARDAEGRPGHRSEEHTSELQSLTNLVCRLLLEQQNH